MVPSEFTEGIYRLQRIQKKRVETGFPDDVV